jgi:hypothetical protein
MYDCFEQLKFLRLLHPLNSFLNKKKEVWNNYRRIVLYEVETPLLRINNIYCV